MEDKMLANLRLDASTFVTICDSVADNFSWALSEGMSMITVDEVVVLDEAIPTAGCIFASTTTSYVSHL